MRHGHRTGSPTAVQWALHCTEVTDSPITTSPSLQFSINPQTSNAFFTAKCCLWISDRDKMKGPYRRMASSQGAERSDDGYHSPPINPNTPGDSMRSTVSSTSQATEDEAYPAQTALLQSIVRCLLNMCFWSVAHFFWKRVSIVNMFQLIQAIIGHADVPCNL